MMMYGDKIMINTYICYIGMLPSGIMLNNLMKNMLYATTSCIRCVLFHCYECYLFEFL